MSEPQTSTEVASLYEAWALAQASIEAVSQNREVEVKMKSGGKYSYSYATLAQILHTIREPLTSNGLWYTQYVRGGEMITRVFHKTGQWMETGMIPIPDMKGAPADVGGIISFFKRYSLSEAMGLATEEDNAAEQGEDRQVDFRARGMPRERPSDHQQNQPPPTPEPEEGWGSWARSFIAKVNAVQKESLLDDLIAEERQFINGSRRIDKMMYEDIGKAITNARAVLNDEAPF
jgi:hypothetical protein